MQFSLLRRSTVVVTLGCVLGMTPLFAQQTDTEVLASGGESHNVTGDIILMWTIGETVIETLNDGSFILAQGVHQPGIKVSILSSNENFKAAISIFPNPTADNLNIQIEKSLPAGKSHDIKAELRDMRGKLVREVQFSGSQYAMDLNLLANGIYILNLTSGNGEFIGSYKIEKLR